MESRNFLGLLFIFPLLLLSLPAHAVMYKWYDEKGKLNYTQSPPPPGGRLAPINTDGFSSVDMYKAPAISLTPKPNSRTSTKSSVIKKKTAKKATRATCSRRR